MFIVALCIQFHYYFNSVQYTSDSFSAQPECVLFSLSGFRRSVYDYVHYWSQSHTYCTRVCVTDICLLMLDLLSDWQLLFGSNLSFIRLLSSSVLSYSWCLYMCVIIHSFSHYCTCQRCLNSRWVITAVYKCLSVCVTSVAMHVYMLTHTHMHSCI